MKEEINYPMELVISDTLKKVLENSDSIVAKKLLELKTIENCSNWINYLDVAKDDATKISYLTKSKWVAVHNKPLIKFKDLKIGDVFICLDATKKGFDSFGLSSVYGNTYTIINTLNQKDTFTPTVQGGGEGGVWNFRECDINICQSNTWNKDFRIMTSCGRTIQKLLGPQDGKELAKFCELFQAHHPDFRFVKDYNIDFVKGEDIRYWYNGQNYFEESGSLGNSCMRYEECQKYFDLYVTNDNIQMFIVKDKDNNKLLGRSLVWDNKYFDRVYAITTTLEEKIRVYLKTLGYIDAYDNDDTITIKLKNGTNNLSRFPYCDTFKYISKDSISNSSDDHIYELNNTDGYWSGHEESLICAISGDEIDEDDCVWVENTGNVHSDYAIYSKWNSCYYLEDDVVYCECLDDSIHKNDATKLYNGEYTHDDRAIKMYDGRYADKEDEELTEIVDGEYALKDDCEYSNLNNGYILDSKTHYCDVQKDWVYEHQLITKNEEEVVEG